MNNADWFKDGAARCASDHARVVREWTIIIAAGWVLFSVGILTLVVFLFAEMYGTAVLLLALDTAIAFKIRNACKIREELARAWLDTRNIYLEAYEKHK